MKASELIGSSVLVLAAADICGTVSNLVFADKLKKVSFLEVFIDDDDDCEVKYIPVKSVFAVGENVVTVKYTADMTAAVPLGLPCPINLPVYDEGGKILGNMTDIELDGWVVTALRVGGKDYPPSEILSRSDVLVIMKKEGSNLKLVQKAKRVPKAKAIPIIERRVSITAAPSGPVPIGIYSFLYGRKASKNISTFDGRLIIPSGALVTPDLVRIAKTSGVIAQLALHTAVE